MSQFDVLHLLLAVTFIILLCSECCDAIKQRIIKGRKCRITYQFAVAILDKSLSIQCGGALLNDRWVVTAAQCCTPDIMYVVAGVPTITWINLLATTKIHIEKCIQHDDYEPKRLLNNIALLQLETSVKENDDIKYAAIPIAQLPDEVEYWYPKCSVMGWGATDTKDVIAKSKTIRCALLDVIPTKKCSKVYTGLPDTVLCTRSKRGSACGRDAGGPLVCNDILYGVASFSGKCSPKIPGVYARIDTYLAFIEPHLLREADSNILNQAIAVIVLACVHIALLL